MPITPLPYPLPSAIPNTLEWGHTHANPLLAWSPHTVTVQLIFVAWTGRAIAVLACLMICVIIGLRIRLARMALRERKFYRRWRPLLMRAALGDTVVFPRLEKPDWALLFGLWNFIHDSVRGSARTNLNVVGVSLGLDVQAEAWVGSPNVRKRLIALIALGNMRHARSWPIWKQMLQDENSVIALAALRGMLLTDPGKAMKVVIPYIAEREDWSPTRVANFLQEAGTDVVAGPLARAALLAEPHQASRLVRYLAALDADLALPAVRKLVNRTKDPGLIAACIPMLRGFEDLTLVRELARHDAWFVRVQAIAALGRLGVPGDEDLLLLALNDREWWVRYRAAQALYGLRYLSEEEFARIRSRQEGFARDMLEHVFAEGPFR
jgi:hypothetical protein